MYKTLQNTLKSDLFHLCLEGLLGTHSTRKFSTTMARSKGGSKDETDFRARWKGGKRQQDSYASVDLPWPDGKVAALLCIGGPIKYSVNSNCGVTREWILRHVVPNIAGFYDPVVAEVLGTAVLWAIFDDEESERVPALMVTRVLAAYTNEIRGTLEANEKSGDEGATDRVPGGRSASGRRVCGGGRAVRHARYQSARYRRKDTGAGPYCSSPE